MSAFPTSRNLTSIWDSQMQTVADAKGDWVEIKHPRGKRTQPTAIHYWNNFKYHRRGVQLFARYVGKGEWTVAAHHEFTERFTDRYRVNRRPVDIIRKQAA